MRNLDLKHSRINMQFRYGLFDFDSAAVRTFFWPNFYNGGKIVSKHSILKFRFVCQSLYILCCAWSAFNTLIHIRHMPIFVLKFNFGPWRPVWNPYCVHKDVFHFYCSAKSDRTIFPFSAMFSLKLYESVLQRRKRLYESRTKGETDTFSFLYQIFFTLRIDYRYTQKYCSGRRQRQADDIKKQKIQYPAHTIRIYLQ